MVNDRLDKFLTMVFSKLEAHITLESNDLFVFTLSHGQTQIERGFNVNAGLLVENLTSSLIVAQRRVYDHLSFNKRSPHGFEIKDELYVSCPNAPSKYKENLKEIKYAEKSKK